MDVHLNVNTLEPNGFPSSTRARLDLLEMSSSVSAESNIFMYLRLDLCVQLDLNFCLKTFHPLLKRFLVLSTWLARVWLVAEGGIWWDQMMSKILLEVKVSNLYIYSTV